MTQRSRYDITVKRVADCCLVQTKRRASYENRKFEAQQLFTVACCSKRALEFACSVFQSSRLIRHAMAQLCASLTTAFGNDATRRMTMPQCLWRLQFGGQTALRVWRDSVVDRVGAIVWMRRRRRTVSQQRHRAHLCSTCRVALAAAVAAAAWTRRRRRRRFGLFMLHDAAEQRC